MPTLQERYQALVAAGEADADPAQARAVRHLAELSRRLEEGPSRSHSLPPWRRVLAGLGARRAQRPALAPVRGVYLWGGVGRGKTWLMDLFYECLPFEDKHRSHFHRFMYQVHEQLRELADTQDPLSHVARNFSSRSRLLCFDELFVSDITDAMLLGTLFRELFAHGVTLVATSNVPPSELYRGGLQRARFLPAIALLEQHTEVVNVDGGIDYRLRLLERAEIYHSPLDAAAEENLARTFTRLCADIACEDTGSLIVEGRSIPARRIGDGVVWFDFASICDGPRGQNDYIALAAEFHTVLVSGVPRLTAELENQARRFIALVDEFYDRNVKLILSAATPVETLYAGDRLGFEFQRTRSRLLEMQTHAYLAKPHLP